MVAAGVPENHGRHGYFGSGGIRGDPRPEFQKPVCASRGGNDSVTPKFIAPGILELVARPLGRAAYRPGGPRTLWVGDYSRARAAPRRCAPG